jgi:hypothetical protein
MIVVTGCSIGKVENIRVRELDYTVVSDRDLPIRLKEAIEERKKDAFCLAFESGGYLYLARGYGAKQTGGYSITVKDLYLGKNSIYIQTELYGPETESKMKKGVSYPYVVIKLEGRKEPVQFL